MDYQQMKEEKEARKKEHEETYAEQLQLMGYISSLEQDNEHTHSDLNRAKGFFAKRRLKKVIKLNDNDIKRYRKLLANMPPVPEFK